MSNEYEDPKNTAFSQNKPIRLDSDFQLQTKINWLNLNMMFGNIWLRLKKNPSSTKWIIQQTRCDTNWYKMYQFEFLLKLKIDLYGSATSAKD